MSNQPATMTEVRRLISEVIQAESKPSMAAEVADRCAAAVLARLRESGVKLVKARAA